MPRNSERNSISKDIIAVILALILAAGSIGCSDETTCPVPADPPRIIAHYPANGDTLVEPDTFLTVTFDVPMDPAMISAGSITLEGPLGTVGASVSLDGATVTLTPFDILAGRSIYTARVAAGVSSKAGTPMGVDYAWSFTTDYSNLLLYPDIEFTVRDSDGDSEPDSIYGNGPPGRHLLVGELQPLIEDRAVMEFPLDEIINDEVLEALVLFTVYDVTDEYTDYRMEAWGFSGNGAADISDWQNGHLIAAYDLTEMNSGNTYGFPMKDTINNALAEGATHAGFRLVVTGPTHAQIYTTDAPEDRIPRLILQQ